MPGRLTSAARSLAVLLLTAVAVGMPTASRGEDEGAGPAPDTTVQQLFLEGFVLQQEGDTQQAIERYRAALALEPDHLPSLYEIGWSYWVLGRWEDVIEVWERVLELAPQYPDAQTIRDKLPEVRDNVELIERSRAMAAAPPPTPSGAAPTIRFALGGDTMLGSPLTKVGLPPDGGERLFAAYSDSMRSADVAFLNLEGTLLDDGESDKCDPNLDTCWIYRTPTAFVRSLVAAGVDLVSLANNHANDFDDEGRRSTRAALDGAGIAWSGPVGSTAVLDRAGVTIGFIAFSTSAGQHDLRNLADVTRRVQGLSQHADLVLVSAHAGAEGAEAQHTPNGPETYLEDDRGDMRAFAHAAIDAGADLVVGHGPHVLRGIEIYRGRLIAYSLGNFVNYGGFSFEGARGLSALLLVDVDRDGRFVGGRLVSARQIPPGGPVLDPDRRAATVVRQLSEADFGDAAPFIDPDGTLHPR
jgi:poly-gamma-glutamate capsule biosynthesis protein CapA/YwtB (metallophosphatase superfamily)